MADNDEPILFSAGIEDDGSLDAESQRIANFNAQMQDFYNQQAQAAEQAAQVGIQADQERVLSTRSLQDVIVAAMTDNAASLQSNAQAQEDWNVVVQSSGSAMAEWKQNVDDLDLQPFSFAIKDSAEAIDAEAQSVNGLSAALGDAQGRLEAFKAAQQEAVQAVISEQPTVEQMTGEVSEEGEGGSTSGFGAARAVRGAANLARIAGVGGGVPNAIMGGADVLLMAQGFEQLKGVINSLADSVGSAITAVGGLGVALPVLGLAAVGVVALVAIINDLNEKSKEATQAAKAFGEALKEAVPTTIGGGQTEIQQAQAKVSQDIIVQNAEKEAELNDIRRHAAEANTTLGTAISKMSDEQILHSSLLQKIYAEDFKSIDAATLAAQKDADVQKILADSTTSATVAANTAAEEARKAAADHITEQQRFEADDKASVKADQDRYEALHSSIAAQQEAIAIIEKSNENVNVSAEQHLKNVQAIKAYNDEIAKEEAEIQHIIGVSEIEAQKREALADADKQFLADIDRISAARKQQAEDENLSAKAIQNKIDVLRTEKGSADDAATAILQHGIATDAEQKKYDALTQSSQDLQDHLDSLAKLLPLAQAREEEKQALSEVEKASKTATHAQDEYARSIEKLRDNLIDSVQRLQEKNQAELRATEPTSIENTFKRDEIALKEQRDVEKVEEETANKITDIHTKLGETETRIEEETSNRIADIYTKLGEEQSKTVTDYNRQIYDDQVKYQQDFQKLQTEANNTLARDALTHAEKLADIQRSSDTSIEQDAADRDFRKLAADLQAKSTQVNKENEAYADQQAQLQLHLSQQEAALGVSLANEEAKQKTAEERKLADEQTAADNEIKRQETDEARKLAQAETAANNAIEQAKTAEDRKIDQLKTSEQQQLEDLRSHLGEERALKAQQFIQEFTQMQIEENQKEQLAAQTEQQIVSQNNAIMAQATQAYLDSLNRLNSYSAGSSAGINPTTNQTTTVSGPVLSGSTSTDNTSGGTDFFSSLISGVGSIFGFAEGGNFQAGQPFVMGEAGPETLNIGANTMGVNAAALVYPLQSGNVDNGGSSKPPDIQALVQAITGALNRSSIDTTPISRAITDGITEIFRP